MSTSLYKLYRAFYKVRDIDKHKFREGEKVKIEEYTTRKGRVTSVLSKYNTTNRRKTN